MGIMGIMDSRACAFVVSDVMGRTVTTMKDDRLISLNTAIDALNKRWRTCIIGESLIRDAKDTLKELPSATDTNVGGNLIDRQAALDALGERPVVWSDNDDYTLGERNQYDMDRLAIETVPPAQPGWIPCTTETMPKNKSNVLTVIYIPGRQAHIRSGWYEDGLFMNDNGDTWKATDKEVVGWMYQPKLPKPYREGGQE